MNLVRFLASSYMAELKPNKDLIEFYFDTVPGMLRKFGIFFEFFLVLPRTSQSYIYS